VLVGRRLGLRVDEQWYCSRECLEQMLRDRLAADTPRATGLRAMPQVRLGTLLAARGVCDPGLLSKALDAQRETGLRLGEQLQAMGAANRDSVLSALATQFGVRCLPAFDATAVRHAPGGLAPAAVAALRVAPISDPAEMKVRVACPAPIPRRAIGALRRLTRWTPEIYLVTDNDWAAIVTHYGADIAPGDAAAAPTFVRTTSLEDAATRIADAAARVRQATLVEARWEGHVWLRIEGAGLLEDVCLAHADAPARITEEAPWLAATTSR